MFQREFGYVLTAVVVIGLLSAPVAAADTGAHTYQQEPPSECREIIERQEAGPQEQVEEPGEIGEEEAVGAAEGALSPIQEDEGLFDENDAFGADEEADAFFADENAEAFGVEEEAGVIGAEEEEGVVEEGVEEAGPVEQINEPGELGPEEAVGPAEGPVASEVQDLTERVTQLEQCVAELIGGPEVAAGEGAAAEEEFTEEEEQQVGLDLTEEEEDQLREFATDEEGLTEEEEEQLGIDLTEAEEDELAGFFE